MPRATAPTLVERMAEPTPTPAQRTMYCPRCDDAVAVISPWSGWRHARTAWWVTLGIVLLVFPIAAADYCVMMPTLMGIVLAGGPLHRLAKQRPICTVCSLEIEGDRKAGTGVYARAYRKRSS